MNLFDMPRRLVGEGTGTALLLAAVIGSGIMGDTLSAENDAIALLGTTIATGAILAVLITVFGPVSGAHFNPAVTLSFLIQKKITPPQAAFYIATQITAGILGMLAAHAMFDLPLAQLSTKERSGFGQYFAETIATFGLIVTILGCVRFRPDVTGYAVGLYIIAGHWFTASTSFANPAVTIARTFTNTFSGIALNDVPAFIVAQLIGAVLATILFGWLLGKENPTVRDEKAD